MTELKRGERTLVEMSELTSDSGLERVSSAYDSLWNGEMHALSLKIIKRKDATDVVAFDDETGEEERKPRYGEKTQRRFDDFLRLYEEQKHRIAKLVEPMRSESTAAEEARLQEVRLEEERVVADLERRRVEETRRREAEAIRLEKERVQQEKDAIDAAKRIAALDPRVVAQASVDAHVSQYSEVEVSLASVLGHLEEITDSTSLETLAVYVGNLRKRPEDERVHTLKLSNDKVATHVLGVPHATEVLLAAGWVFAVKRVGQEMCDVLYSQEPQVEVDFDGWVSWNDKNAKVEELIAERLDEL